MKGTTDIDEGAIRRIDWQELCPPVILLRAFPFTIRPIQLVIATIILVVLLVFAGNINHISPQGVYRLSSHVSVTAMTPPCQYGVTVATTPETAVWGQILLPFYQLAEKSGDEKFASLTFCGLILLFFWMVFARTAAVRIASTQQSGFFASLKFSLKKMKSLLLALTIPCLLFATAWGFCKFGFGHSCPANGLEVIASPVAAVAAFIAVFFKVILLFGFPLMIAAVVTDRSDGFDALSRTISYMTQRPLHYLLYLILALIPGLLGYVIVSCFSIEMGRLLFDFGNGAVFFNWYEKGICLRFLFLLVYLFPLGFLYIYAIYSSTAIYLMLRRSLDGTPVDEFQPTDEHRPTRKLQKILRDETGAPVVPEKEATKDDHVEN